MGLIFDTNLNKKAHLHELSKKISRELEVLENYLKFPIVRNLQTFGFEFHLRSIPYAFSIQSVSKSVALLLAAATPC